jgi:CheY-like chemotaxis protein
MKRLLVVEDSPEDFLTVSQAAQLSPIPITLVRAIDADSAMGMLHEAGQSPFDLIFLDNNLPGLSGYEMLLLVRNDPKLKHIPIIMLTTSANPRECAACYRGGVNAYHVKALAFTEWRQTLGHILEYWLKWPQLPMNDGRGR